MAASLIKETLNRKAITLSCPGTILIRIGKQNRTRFVGFDYLLWLAADDPTFSDALEWTLAQAQARLRATRQREAAKVVSLDAAREARREPEPVPT